MYTFTFFRVVPPVPPLMVATFAVLTTLGAVSLAVNPGSGAGAIAPVLVLQVFAAATGFAMPARRGHYDLLLTSGDGRLRIAVAHFLASAAPGLASWLALGGIELLVSRGSASAVLSSGTCASMFMTSAVPWALSIALPRFSAAVGWLLVVLASSPLMAPDRTAEAWRALPPPEASGLTGAVVFLIYPLRTAGYDLGPREWLTILPALTIALGLLAAACWWVVRADFPLEAAQ
jgi:hypothetical protein